MGFWSRYSPSGKGIGHKIGRKCTRHVDFAVGEVDHQEDAVYERIAQGDQGVDAALGKSRDGKAQPLAGSIFAGQYCIGSTYDHQSDNGEA